MEHHSRHLSFEDLHICSKVIGSSRMNHLAFQLGLTHLDLDHIDYQLNTNYPSKTLSDKMFLVLCSWKSKFPQNCQSLTLKLALEQLNQFTTAAHVEQVLSSKNQLEHFKTPVISPNPPKLVESYQVAHDGTLSHTQLMICCKKISCNMITTVGRQLGLCCKDFDEVDYKHSSCSPPITATGRKFLILAAWKEKYPQECTSKHLEHSLRQCHFNQTADNVIQTLSEHLHLLKDLKEDGRSGNRTEISEQMAGELSKMIGGHWELYQILGFELGLSQQQLDHAQFLARNCHLQIYNTLNILKFWIRNEGHEALLGQLYSALCRMDYQELASRVYHHFS